MVINPTIKMKKSDLARAQRRRAQGFSFIETMVGMMLLGITLGGLLTGISTVGKIIAYGREEAKAVEIVSETIDSIRLYSWNQITNSAFMPQTFLVTETSSGNTWDYAPEMPGTDISYTKLSAGNTLTDSALLVDTAPTDTNVYISQAAQQGVYYGAISVNDAGITEGYGSQVKMVKVQLQWVSHNKTNTTEMQTLISQHGLQGRIVN